MVAKVALSLMLILDFTNQRNYLLPNRGFFSSGVSIGGRAEYNSDQGNTYEHHSEKPLIDAKAINGNKSLASYFNCLNKIN